MRLLGNSVLRAIMLLVCSHMVPSSGNAQQASQGGSDEEAPCQALGRADFSGIPDAPLQITAASLVNAEKDSPAYCKVEGYIAPQVGFELRLPVSAWNGKFMEIGCGGLCGSVFGQSCADPLRRGYACVVTDMGHKGVGFDSQWAYNNLQAMLDFGYRSTHVVAVAGKELTKHFYGKAPARSYFMGCSTGGRQAWMQAQRFPWDFDGIVAGAPAVNNMLNQLWSPFAIRDKNGKPLLSTAELQTVHEAAIAKCDLDDGLKDGVIGDPRTCAFDPAALICKAGQTGCLREAQVAAMKKLYSGPVTSDGKQILPVAAFAGAELGFASFLNDTPYGRDFFRYMAFAPYPGPHTAEEFDFDRDYKRLGAMDAWYWDANPDLRKFKAAGGKLISYHGWSDSGMGGIPPLNSVDYYETVERTMGGREATQDFFRLFMVPGMDHCLGGSGAFAIDYLHYLEAWVEQGRVPDVMIAAHVDLNQPGAWPLKFPMDSSKVKFTRPVYPYPVQAKYKGRGNPNEAKNFGPVKP